MFARATSLKKYVFGKLTLSLKNELIQTNIISNSKSTFKVNVTIGQGPFLILLTFALNN